MIVPRFRFAGIDTCPSKTLISGVFSKNRPNDGRPEKKSSPDIASLY